MNELSSWKYSTVYEFLESYNWSGRKQRQTLVSNREPDAEVVSWPRQTVQSFLSQYNWTGRPLERQESGTPPLEFSTRLGVSDFFQFFTWEGQPHIAAIPDIPKSSSINLEDDLNLNDFSDMF